MTSEEVSGWGVVLFFVIGMIGMAVVYSLAEYKWKKKEKKK